MSKIFLSNFCCDFHWLHFICIYSLSVAGCSAPNGQGDIRKSTDKLVIAVPNKFKTIDPRRVTIAQEIFVLPLIFEYLFRVNAKDETVAELAESWDFARDTSTISIKLRNDRFFSDGTPVSNRDVADTLINRCNESSISHPALLGLLNCGSPNVNSSIKLRDLNLIDLKITSSATAFLVELTKGSMAISKKDKMLHLIGSGPYRVKTFDSTQVELVKNDSYRPEVNKVYPRLLELKYVPESQILDALKANQIDIATMYLSYTLAGVRLSDFKVFTSMPRISQILVLNASVYPFSNLELRNRLKSKMEEFPFSKCGKGRFPAVGVIPTGLGGALDRRFANQELKVFALKKKIVKAPYINSKPVTIFQHIGRKNQCEEEIMSSIFHELRINVRFKYITDYTELDKIVLDKRTPAYVELFVVKNRDAGPFLSRFSPSTTEPLFFYTSKEIKVLLDRAQNESRIEFRFPIYREINRLIDQRSSAIPLYYIGHSTVARGCLTQKQEVEIDTNPNSFLFLFDGSLNLECRDRR